jgi:hypothetical protein
MQPTSRFQRFFANKKLVALCFVAVIVLLIMIVPRAQRQSGFNPNGTDPKLSDMATITPYIRVKFTRDLSDKNLKYTASGDFIKSHKISGKTLQLNFRGGKFEAGKTYSITIQSITDKNGETITNYKLEFKTIQLNFDSLSGEQQKAVIASQDTFDYSPQSITFNGADDLVDHGLTQYQLTGLKEALFRYSRETGKKYQDITIVRSTIEEGGVVPDSGRSSLFFTVTFDNAETFKAQLDAFDTTAIQLYLRDIGNGQTVYDSGSIDSFDQ